MDRLLYFPAEYVGMEREKTDPEPKCAVGAPRASVAPTQPARSAAAVAWEGWQQFSRNYTHHNLDILV